MNKPRYEGGAGSGYLDALDGQYSTPPRYNCKSCAILTHWPLCPDCYRWRVHFNAVQQAMLAIRGIYEP
jgi:hypothetical protein